MHQLIERRMQEIEKQSNIHMDIANNNNNNAQQRRKGNAAEAQRSC